MFNSYDLFLHMLLLCRRVVNGLQVLIAKGRKNKRRGPLAGNYAPVHVSNPEPVTAAAGAAEAVCRAPVVAVLAAAQSPGRGHSPAPAACMYVMYIAVA